ncbi:Hypothetical predicted protein [Paramuricea clavata]|uniref:Uncharacterized protein n=1 Tax=Paramuricea clavata TaxID=317549 RepID=A0A7D9DEE8_PARCT|nr:Hypothetical predicted protein [Paramuricea clavata]
MAENLERDDRSKSRRKTKATGFSLSNNAVESEKSQREKENEDVKDIISRLDESLVRKLAIRSLRRGIGSMDYMDTFLIMEDDLDDTENVGELWQSSTERPHDETSTQDACNSQNPGSDPDPT